ncbi:GSCFA domain-containing protein [Flavicella sp.]|uniref:GSCFA domain-containing protein n=1 Tax=Flavicella sp. TaxID=2957742 RepID=UPI003015B5FB
MENSNFRTQYKTKPQSNQIDYSSNLVLFGSCFSENIDKKFDYFKFKTTSNPYGILFNPAAIEKAISECLEKKIYTEQDLIFYNGLWHSFNHHSDFSGLYKDEVLNNINSTIQKGYNQLKSASHIIITLGTAWVYKLIEENNIVANCHKIPQKRFNKIILSVDEIVKILENIKRLIKKINSQAIFIFTVSPVRHLKDGMIENTQSKSHLLIAIHRVISPQTFYFPSYEIMLDDLRDYRFYKQDMIHPNQLAMDYIWTLFKNTWISQNSEFLFTEIDAIQKALQHKPFNPDSEQHKLFVSKLKRRIYKLKKDANIRF